MKVKALRDCFVDGARRRKGATFDFTPTKDADGKDVLFPKILEQVVPMRMPAAAAAAKKEEKAAAFGALIPDK